jgi:hypothetical protein
MNSGSLFGCFRRVFAAAIVAVFAGGGACNRGTEPEQHPLRKQVVGKWEAGRSTGGVSWANLELNPDGTFQYVYQAAAKPTLTVNGNWTIEDRSIVGLVKTVENGTYKAGDSFAFGEIVSVDDGMLKLRKETGLDEYHRRPEPNATK